VQANGIPITRYIEANKWVWVLPVDGDEPGDLLIHWQVTGTTWGGRVFTIETDFVNSGEIITEVPQKKAFFWRAMGVGMLSFVVLSVLGWYYYGHRHIRKNKK
jgi:hypothetical protein